MACQSKAIASLDWLAAFTSPAVRPSVIADRKSWRVPMTISATGPKLLSIRDACPVSLALPLALFRTNSSGRSDSRMSCSVCSIARRSCGLGITGTTTRSASVRMPAMASVAAGGVSMTMSLTPALSCCLKNA
jgi:hypothetical protein